MRRTRRSAKEDDREQGHLFVGPPPADRGGRFGTFRRRRGHARQQKKVQWDAEFQIESGQTIHISRQPITSLSVVDIGQLTVDARTANKAIPVSGPRAPSL